MNNKSFQRPIVLCFWPNPFPYKNMAIRHRILNLAENYHLTFVTKKDIEIPQEVLNREVNILRSPFKFSNNLIDLLFFFLWSLLKIISFKKNQFEYCYSFQELTSILGFTTTKFKKSKYWILDVLDDPALELKNWERRTRSTKRHLMIIMLSFLENTKKRIFKYTDLVVVQGMSNKHPIPMLLNQKYAVSIEKMVWVPNGVDLGPIVPKGLKQEDGFCIFYGRTPASTTNNDKPKPASPVTIIGKIKGNFEELKKLKEAKVRIEN